MMHLINQTPFQAVALPSVCHEDNHYVVVVVKGTFSIGKPDQGVFVSGKQEEICWADEYWGEPGKFSLKYEADTALSKPGTDVVMVGKARSSRGPVQQLDVSLQAGEMQKVVRVFGDRHWERTSTGWKMTPPEAFESIPLVYEFAFGGQDPWTEEGKSPDVDQRNPVGRGYAGKKSHQATDKIRLPNLEFQDQLITDIRDRPEPAGFGFVARNWQPRCLLMGTYDEAWETQRNPLLPSDFDPACFAAASSGMCADYFFSGGEEIVASNVTLDGELRFTLPERKIKVVSYIEQQRVEHETLLDTVIIEPHRKRVLLTWRVAIPCHWNLSKIEWIKVLEAA